MISESGEFTPLYQGRPSKFWEGDNLISHIEHMVDSGEL